MAARVRVTRKDARVYQQNIFGEAEECKPKRKPKRNWEEDDQVALFGRRDEYQSKYRPLCRLFATLNGIYVPPALLSRVKRSGLTKGVLDIWLPIRRVDADGNVWGGLVIDLKRKGKGKPSPEQLEWARDLVENGYRAYFCEGSVEAWRAICCYLGITGADHVARDLEEWEDWTYRQTT